MSTDFFSELKKTTNGTPYVNKIELFTPPPADTLVNRRGAKGGCFGPPINSSLSFGTSEDSSLLKSHFRLLYWRLPVVYV